MTVQPVEKAQVIHVVHQLNVEYRCDRCGAQALVEAQLRVGGDLYFCSHDYNVHEAKMLTIASKIVDHRKEEPSK